MENYADEQLLESYLNGEKEALDLLIKRYLKPIFGFVFSYIKNSEDAEEITQDAFSRPGKISKNLIKKKVLKRGYLALPKTQLWIF